MCSSVLLDGDSWLSFIAAINHGANSCSWSAYAFSFLSNISASLSSLAVTLYFARKCLTHHVATSKMYDNDFFKFICNSIQIGKLSQMLQDARLIDQTKYWQMKRHYWIAMPVPKSLAFLKSKTSGTWETVLVAYVLNFFSLFIVILGVNPRTHVCQAIYTSALSDFNGVNCLNYWYSPSLPEVLI